MFQGHLTDEGWQEESSRVLEQRPKMHGHHTSSGVCLEHWGLSPDVRKAWTEFAFFNEGWYIARWPVEQGLERQ